MPADENKALVRRAWEAFAGQEGLDRLAAFYAADYVAHRTDGETSGWAANRRYMEAVFAAFPDLRVTVEDLVAEGDRVVSRVTLRGTHRGELYGIAPTGAAVAFVGTNVARVEGGKIAEEWELYDDLGLLRQLGALPGPA